MTDPTLQSEIRTLRQSGMRYSDIVRLLKRNRTLGHPRVINLRELGRICRETKKEKP